MFERGNMNGGNEMRRWAMAFAGNLVAILTLLIIGFPLAPATIRTMLLGWFLVVAGITRIALGNRTPRTESAVVLSATPAGRANRRRFR